MYLLPQVQRLTPKSGSFFLKYKQQIALAAALPMESLVHAELLARELSEYAIAAAVTRSAAPVAGAINLAVKELPHAEGYTIEIERSGVTIEGGSTAGLLYGIQTLRQIIRQSGAELPCLSIEDYPELPNRGFFHDVTRGQVPTLASLKALADKMSEYKLNQLQLYIEHSFLLEGFSEMWRDDDPLTAAEIVELDSYCRSLCIELVPSIASFGHFYKLLSTASFAHLCELDDSTDKPFSFVGRMRHHTLDVGNPESLAMVEGMIAQFLPLFSSSKFNIGADETFDLGKGKSKAMAEQQGVGRLYVDFLKKLMEIVERGGKQPMFWGDIVLKHPEYLPEIPKGAICLNWAYHPGVTDEETRIISESGIPQYLCPGVSGWNHLINIFEDSYSNISAMCRYAYQYKALGVLNTNWGDYGNVHLPESSEPGLVYGAALCWNSVQPSYEEMNRQVSLVEYGDSEERLMEILDGIAGCQMFPWNRAVEYMEQGCDLPERVQVRLAEFMAKLDPQEVHEANQRLAELTDELYRALARVRPAKRDAVAKLLVMTEGIRLTNLVGVSIKTDDKQPASQKPAALACELEGWLQDYKKAWRSTSKESELYRVLNIFYGYADRLRKMEAR